MNNICTYYDCKEISKANVYNIALCKKKMIEDDIKKLYPDIEKNNETDNETNDEIYYDTDADDIAYYNITYINTNKSNNIIIISTIVIIGISYIIYKHLN